MIGRDRRLDAVSHFLHYLPSQDGLDQIPRHRLDPARLFFDFNFTHHFGRHHRAARACHICAGVGRPIRSPQKNRTLDMAALDVRFHHRRDRLLDVISTLLASMRRFCDFFRLNNSREILLIALIGTLFYSNCRTVLFATYGPMANQRAQLHSAVLSGQAAAPYQYQMYMSGLILETLLRVSPEKNAVLFLSHLLLFLRRNFFHRASILISSLQTRFIGRRIFSNVPVLGRNHSHFLDRQLLPSQ